MNELIAVSTGLFAGTITGIVPGAGVMVAMIIATPLLMHFDVIQLLLFGSAFRHVQMRWFSHATTSAWNIKFWAPGTNLPKISN